MQINLLAHILKCTAKHILISAFQTEQMDIKHTNDWTSSWKEWGAIVVDDYAEESLLLRFFCVAERFLAFVKRCANPKNNVCTFESDFLRRKSQ